MTRWHANIKVNNYEAFKISAFSHLPNLQMSISNNWGVIVPLVSKFKKSLFQRQFKIPLLRQVRIQTFQKGEVTEVF